MTDARTIVSALLETGEIDPADEPTGATLTHYFDQMAKAEASGKVTPKAAMNASEFYHRTLKYKDGKTPIRVRRNGATKTWKTRPGEFRIPVKYGMYEYFYIDQNNADEWSTIPDPPPA
jgi:hypothetical protein